MHSECPGTLYKVRIPETIKTSEEKCSIIEKRGLWSLYFKTYGTLPNVKLTIITETTIFHEYPTCPLYEKG
jgi:hypothetical protein